MSTEALKSGGILQVSSQLLDKTRGRSRGRSASGDRRLAPASFPNSKNDARRQLNEIERRLGAAGGSAALSRAAKSPVCRRVAKLKR